MTQKQTKKDCKKQSKETTLAETTMSAVTGANDFVLEQGKE